jgi:hypothetical protein
MYKVRIYCGDFHLLMYCLKYYFDTEQSRGWGQQQFKVNESLRKVTFQLHNSTNQMIIHLGVNTTVKFHVL